MPLETYSTFYSRDSIVGNKIKYKIKIDTHISYAYSSKLALFIFSLFSSSIYESANDLAHAGFLSIMKKPVVRSYNKTQ